jgi:hypothetical protein
MLEELSISGKSQLGISVDALNLMGNTTIIIGAMGAFT